MARRLILAAAIWVLGYGFATGQSPPRTSRTVEAVLHFDRNDLQKALETLSGQIGVPIEIDKDDMRIAGITQCQSQRMEEAHLTVEEWLQKLLKGANPDGNLVYTVRKSESGVKTVWIVTRHGAKKRGEELFPEFTIK